MNLVRTNRARMSVCVGLLLGSMVLSSQTGCGSSDPFSYVEVSGKVTYEDGSLIPIPEGGRLEVLFTPQMKELDAKTFPRPARGTVDAATGQFDVVTSHNYGDGIVPGKHNVTLEAHDEQDRQLFSVFSRDYSDISTSPFEIDTADGRELEFKVKKP